MKIKDIAYILLLVAIIFIAVDLIYLKPRTNQNHQAEIEILQQQKLDLQNLIVDSLALAKRYDRIIDSLKQGYEKTKYKTIIIEKEFEKIMAIIRDNTIELDYEYFSGYIDSENRK